MYYRLRLDSYSEEDSNGKQVAKYSFGYNNGLPCKASAAIDYWGYYNGKENFNGRYHTLLPKHWDELTSDVEDGFPKTVYFTGADRRFYENCASAFDDWLSVRNVTIKRQNTPAGRQRFLPVHRCCSPVL